MSFTNRFSAIDKAIVTTIGNSLVICGDTQEMVINTSSLVTPTGTATRNWTECGSSSVLNILDDSTILFAELIWYSTVKSNQSSATDYRSIQDSAATFTTPNGDISVVPVGKQTFTQPSGTINYFRSADLTSVIRTSKGGTYTLSKIPVSVPTTGLSDSVAGWSLTVIYQNSTFPPKKIDYHSGIQALDPALPYQKAYIGFEAAKASNHASNCLFLTAAGGNPLTPTKNIKAGATFARLSFLGNNVGKGNPNPGTVPNMPYNNAFTGMINLCDPIDTNFGLLNVTGTAGSQNHDSFLPQQHTGARNKLDLTGLFLNDVVVKGQNQLTVQMETADSGSSIQLLSMASMIEVMAPDIRTEFQIFNSDGVNVDGVQVGEKLVYSLVIKNTGTSAADNVTISTSLDPSCTYLPGSFQLNGAAVSQADIGLGVNLGTIAPAGVHTVIFSVSVHTLPASRTIDAVMNYNYQFTSGTGSPLYTTASTTAHSLASVFTGNISVVKSSSKATANMNDVLEYTTLITNTGTVTATNLLFQDFISTYTLFLPGSVSVNGTVHSDYDTNLGFALPNLNAGAICEVKFRVTVNHVPPLLELGSKSAVTYNCLYSTLLAPITQTVFSSYVQTRINHAEVIGVRCSDNNYPLVGDIVTYTLTLTNIGNITSEAIPIFEPTVPGTEFVSGSVTVNGVPQSGYNPYTGFQTAPIQPQQTITVNYGVNTTQLAPGEVIENIANIPFHYQISSQTPVVESTINSNRAVTRAKYVDITGMETVDKPFGTIGDALFYQITIKNNGNISASNTMFLSDIAGGTELIADSVTVNGLSRPGADPGTGFTIGTLCPTDTVIIGFRVQVVRIPQPNAVYNQSNFIYDYLPDPLGTHITETIITNTVKTTLNESTVSITKKVDHVYASLNDTLVYTTTITNTGTVPLQNIFFIDSMVRALTLWLGTVTVSGISHPDYNPVEGFYLNNIPAFGSVVVVFSSKISTLPITGYVQNKSCLTYTSQVNPNSPILRTTKYSNDVVTSVRTGELSVTKAVDKVYGKTGDVLTYTISISNTGNIASNITNFFDPAPNSTAFVPESVSVNGQLMPTYNPGSGFSLGIINPGQVTVVRFQTTVTAQPVPNVITNAATVVYRYSPAPDMAFVTGNITSNTANTTINQASSSIVCASDKATAKLNDVINYTLTIKNTGTVPLSSTNFTDILPDGTTFNAGTVTINGVSYPTYVPTNSFILGTIDVSETIIVNFTVVVTSPTITSVSNQANISYQYALTPSDTPTSVTQTSNTVVTDLKTLAITHTLTPSKQYANIGDTITYTASILTSGNTTITAATFTDVIVPYAQFVTGTLAINGQTYPSYHPNQGFPLGEIRPATPVNLTFDVTVIQAPPSGVLPNTANVSYLYYTDSTVPPITQHVLSNTVSTIINHGALTILGTASRTHAILTDIVRYTFVLANTGNTTLRNVSLSDLIQSNSSFLANTVMVNGIVISGAVPGSGITIGTLNTGRSAKVEFDVRVNTVPNDGILLNKGSAAYSYYVNPDGPITAVTIDSSPTTVNVSSAIITATMQVDKSIMLLNDALNYTIVLTNTGTAPVQSLNLQDILDTHLTFVTNTVTINNVTQTGYDPNTGFALPDMAAGTTLTIRFSTTATGRPDDNTIYNLANINYSYQTSGQPVLNIATTTNTVQTFVALGALQVIEEVNKAYASINDTLIYTIKITNTGSVNATGVSLRDLTPANTTFTTGSVVVNGLIQPGFNPDSSFALADLVPHQIHTIVYQVKVASLPSLGVITNKADISFSYKLLPTGSTASTTTSSNTVTTAVKQGNLTVGKTVNKAYAAIDTVLTYTITVSNTGNTVCSNVYLTDIVDRHALFNLGSITIDGISENSFNPNNGFVLPDIDAGASQIIRYQATVKTLPANTLLPNLTAIDYQYFVNPTEPALKLQSVSQTVTTTINQGSMTLTNFVSKQYATIGDLLKYTIVLTNTGTVTGTAINFRDIIQSGSQFIAGSVTIDGVEKADYNPYESFPMGTLTTGKSTVVSFQVRVTSLPALSTLLNTATAIFTYRIDPSGTSMVAETTSNTVTTAIRQPVLSMVKTANKSYVIAGDTMLYTITLSNTGNTELTSLNFADSLPPEASFTPNSVYVDGVNQRSFDPTVGFSLGTILPLAEKVVNFTVTIGASDINESVVNYAIGTYSYQIEPDGEVYTGSVKSNTISTEIRRFGMTVTKYVDLNYAALGDVLNYSIFIKNTGNSINSALQFIDVLSGGVDFVVNSVSINGIASPGLHPVTGFLLHDMAHGSTTVIRFSVLVTGIPQTGIVTNQSSVSGTYKIDPAGSDHQLSATSNTVQTIIKAASLSNVLTVNKAYAQVSDVLSYTSVITNTGNTPIFQIQFYDLLIQGLIFVKGSVRINGVVNSLLSLTSGFLLGDLAPTQSVTVDFQAKIYSLPLSPAADNMSQCIYSYYVDPNGSTITKTMFSNTVITNVIQSVLTIAILADKSIATVGDLISYDVKVTNTGNVAANSAMFYNTLSFGAVFATGSVSVNGLNQPLYDPALGFQLGDIGIGNSVTILFQATVSAVPASNAVTSQSEIRYNYLLDPKQPPILLNAFSNTVSTSIAKGELTVVKTVDKQYATLGDLLTYVVTVTNVGNIDATSIVFLDPIPLNTIFVTATIKVNGISHPGYNPEAGFSLNTMKPGEIIVVQYQVEVVS